VDLQPGIAISSNLTLVRLLGRGSMGSVWVASHRALHTEVAVKFMSASTIDDPTLVERFSREARAAAQLKSPHVVKIFDHGVTEEGQPYIVMELLDGEPLFRRCKRDGPLSLPELVQVVTQVCKALASAHELGVVHRDIKPSNIFLTDSAGELFVKVLDFGVAKLADEQALDMTTDGNVLGTPGYMSPEQFTHASSVDFRSDLWSLGVVAYLSLTGQRPFPGQSVAEVFRSVQRATPAPPSALRPDLSPEVDAWFARALARDRHARFASAKQMAQQLELAVGFPSAMGSTPSLVASGVHALATFPGTSIPGERASLFGSKRPVVVAGVALAVGVMAVVGGLAYFAGQRTSDPPAPAQAAGTAEPTRGAEPAPSDEPEPSMSTDTGSAPAEQPSSREPPDPPPTDEPSEQPPREARDGGAPPAASGAQTSAPHTARPPQAPMGEPAQADERTKRAAEELGI